MCVQSFENYSSTVVREKLGPKSSTIELKVIYISFAKRIIETVGSNAP